jgi:Xaa-Pro dipeptidase
VSTNSASLDIDVAACRGRQQRLLAVMQRLNVDLAIVTQIEHVQYFVGPRFAWTMSPVAAIEASGRVTLVAPNKAPDVAAADEVLTYEAQWHSTLRNDQRRASSDVLLKAFAGRPAPQRIGVESSCFTQHLLKLGGQVVDLEPELFRLRRKKDPDELARLRKAIAATGAMYARAREIIRPGVQELDVFNELQAVAVRECGEMLTGTGNDYQCGEMGGPPRHGRAAQAGELYILDLGPAFRGYFADNSRAIAVTEPSKEQLAAWQTLQEVFAHIHAVAKPGKRCQELFHEVQALCDRAPYGKFSHHLGHGIGLFPHETPHLNPHWDDVFEVGDVFTCEPGLYAPELKAGMRLENDYLVTEAGIENLSNFPMALKL